jgi:DNA-binding CsgD family transcriptional regulator
MPVSSPIGVKRCAEEEQRAVCHDAAVAVIGPETRLADGHAALVSGDWAAARLVFEELVERSDDPEAIDGLGRALWWLKEPRAALVQRERAYAGFRRQGELERAARIALWIAREYDVVWDNHPAANGWLARAERLLAGVDSGSGSGWLELGRSERAHEPRTAISLARSALEIAEDRRDIDLEVRALGQLGLALVSGGAVDEGLRHIDEAMAAVTGEEPPSLETFADVCCTLLLACERAGDTERPARWIDVLESFARRFDHVVLLAFCRTCCAGVHVATGRVDAAETELEAALRELVDAGQRGRCLHPAARLAEIRVLQGRLEEADQLLVGFEHDPATLDARVGLASARGRLREAAMLLEDRLAETGADTFAAAPLLARLVEVLLRDGRRNDAAVAATKLELLAAGVGRERISAMALLAMGRIAMQDSERRSAELLRDAVNLYAGLGLRLEAARARLDLARALALLGSGDAVGVGRRALAELEALGAMREADEAAAFLRSMGAKGRSRPRLTSALTGREVEVLRLVGEGLTNAQIGGRLFISPKTAEHHVSRILRKLDVRTRSEAAAYAVRHLGLE